MHVCPRRPRRAAPPATTVPASATARSHGSGRTAERGARDGERRTDAKHEAVPTSRSSPRRPRRGPTGQRACPLLRARSRAGDPPRRARADRARSGSPRGRLLRRRLAGGPPQRRGVLTEVDGDPIEPGADPDHLAGGTERVEVGRAIARHAPRQHVALPERDGKRDALERDDRLAQRLTAPDPVP